MNSCRDCKYNNVCFEQLSYTEIDKISNNKTQIIYNKGETIIKQGIPVTFYLNIRKGLVKLHIKRDNKTTILGIMSSGQAIGLDNLGRNKMYDYSVTAIEEQTEVCLIDAAIINQIMKNNGAFASFIFRKSNRHLFYLFNELSLLANNHLDKRIAIALLNLSKELKQADPDIIPITQKEIGELTSMSTVSVIRIMKTFKENGLIGKVNGKTKIKNYSTLEKIAGM
jgi:CRP-like cAMP-binding protein